MALLEAPTNGRLLGATRAVSTDSRLRQRLSSGALSSVREKCNVRVWTGKVRESYAATAQGRRGIE